MKVKIGSLAFALLFSFPAFAEEAITLDQFLAQVQGENLALKAEEASASAAKEGAAGIALPAPMAGIAQMKDQSGKATGWEVSQAIPFPTKISSDHDARNANAEAKAAMLTSRELEIRADARLVYFRLWKAQERARLLEEKKNAIEQHLKLTRAATRSDSFMKIHLVKTEGDLDLLKNEITVAEQERREAQIQMAEYLNRSPQDFKPVSKEFVPSAIPSDEASARPALLEAKRWDLESLKARESEAKASWMPDFSVRYREAGGTGMNPRYSEIMLGASVPFLFFWQPRAESGKAAAERLEGEYRFDLESRRIESRRASLVNKAESLKKQLDQFRVKIVPNAEKRVRLVYNVAPRDLETLQDHREAMESLPELKLKALDLRDQYEETVAELEKLGGRK
jgi:outer membrane protein TolC